MTTFTTRLSENLLDDIKTADEIWIAVALMSNEGLNFIIDNLKPSCRQNYLIGIDLPTDPKALRKLIELQLRNEINVHIHTDKECFHPKLYLIKKEILKKETSFIAYIGSANCTNGGLFNNVELTTRFTYSDTCEQLLKWFNRYFNAANPLTTGFLDKYQVVYDIRQERKKREDKLVSEEKQDLNDEVEAILVEKNKFIKILKDYRKGKDYDDVVIERAQTIMDLRTSLDYPSFNKIDIEKYFSYPELGHLIAIAKPAIKRNIPQLRKLLHWLCDEKVDIALRYDSALNGDLKVEGVSKAFISKVLIAHRPELYYVKNDKTEKALRKYGIKFPRGLSEGIKYKITCRFLHSICIETGIKDLSVLDNYLYIEGNNE